MNIKQFKITFKTIYSDNLILIAEINFRNSWLLESNGRRDSTIAETSAGLMKPDEISIKQVMIRLSSEHLG